MKNIIALLLVTIFISSCGSSETEETPASSDTAPVIVTELPTQNTEETDVKDATEEENINTTGTGDEITSDKSTQNTEEETTTSEDELVDETIQEIDDLFKLLESDDK